MSVKLNLNNKIINGAFEYWQRGTSFPAIAAEAYHTDRWDYSKDGTMVHTISRSTDVPTNAFGVYSLLVQCTTAQASMAAGNYAVVRQFIEGNVLRTFKNKKVVLSFWVKATKTGTYCVSLRNSSVSRRSLVKEYSVSSSNTWEKKVIRLQHDDTGTWVYNNGIGVIVDFVIAIGSTYTTPSPDVWLSEDKVATPNQVNGCDTIGNTFQLADVCMVEDNEGQTREPEFQLAGRDLFEELQLCQRYYEKSWGVNTPTGSTGLEGIMARRGASGDIYITVDFKVEKRATPTIGFWDDQGNGGFGINARIIRNAIRNQGFSTGASWIATSRFSFVDSNSGFEHLFHWVADAEL